MSFLQPRDCSRTLARGPDAKKVYCKKILGLPHPSDLKISGPPFLPWKSWVNSIEKHANSIFTGKFVFFFQGYPLQGSKFLRALILHQTSRTSVCERSVTDVENLLHSLVFDELYDILFKNWMLTLQCYEKNMTCSLKKLVVMDYHFHKIKEKSTSYN